MASKLVKTLDGEISKWKLKFALFLIGDSYGFVPTTWPRSMFQKALLDMVTSFGNTMMICEFRNGISTQSNISNIALDTLVGGVVLSQLKNPGEKPKEGSKLCKVCLVSLSDVRNINNENEKNEPETKAISKNKAILNGFEPVNVNESNQDTAGVLEETTSYLLNKEIKEVQISKSFHMTIPTLMVVVEGDLETIRHVKIAVDKNIPVLLLKGSGMAADLLSVFIEEYDDDANDNIFKTKAPLLFGVCFNKAKFDELKGLLTGICQKKWLFGIVDVKDNIEHKMNEVAMEIVLRNWSLINITADNNMNKKDNRYNFNTEADIGEAHMPSTREIYNIQTDSNRPPEPVNAYPTDQDEPGHLTSGNSPPEPVNAYPTDHDELGHLKSGNRPPGAVNLYPTDHDELGQLKKMFTPHHGQNPIARSTSVRIKSAKNTRGTDENDTDDTDTENVNGNDTEIQNTESIAPLAFYLAYQHLQEKKKPENVMDFAHDSSFVLQTVESYGKLMQASLQNNRYDIVESMINSWGNLPVELKEIQSMNTKVDEPITDTKDMAFHVKKRTSIDLSEEDSREICMQLLKYSDADNDDKMKDQNERLFLWAVLTNKREMASIFWKLTRNPIFSALVAYACLRSLAKSAKEYRERILSEDLESHSRLFSERAIHIAESLYDVDIEMAEISLQEKGSFMNIRLDSLDIANDHGDLDFISTRVPQRVLNKIWFGDRYSKKLEFFMSCFQAKHRTEDRNKKLHETNCSICCNRDQNKNHHESCCSRALDVLKAPCTKFYVHYLIYIGYLVCLSAFVLTNVDKWDPTTIASMTFRTTYAFEYITYIYLIGDAIEEYRDIFVKLFTKTRAIRKILKRHFFNFWNILDLLAMLTMLTAVILRFFAREELDATRQVLSIAMFLMYMRLFNMIISFKKIGPVVIMLKEAILMLFMFAIIALVFIGSTGVFYHANIYPNHYDMFSTFGIRYWTFWKIIYLPYWAVYGEFKSELEGELDNDQACSSNQTVYMNDINIERCPEKVWIVSAMSGIYALITNLVLVNLVIAMFSFRFEEIQNNAEKLWAANRSRVIREYKRRFPVPLNLIILIPFIIYKLCQSCNKVEDSECSTLTQNRTKAAQILAARLIDTEKLSTK